MKRLIFVMFLASASAFGAGNVTQSMNQLGTSGNVVIGMAWTGDAISGAVPSTNAFLQGCCQGYTISQVEIVPLSPSPTNGYNITITDPAGVDALGGQGAGLSSTTATSFGTSTAYPPLQGTFTLNVSGQLAAGAKGIVYIFLSPPTSAFRRFLNSALAMFTHIGIYPPGTVGARLQETISVRDAPFYAAGNGVKDDTAALTRAGIAAVASGKCLFFPPGTYAVTSVGFSAGSAFLCLTGSPGTATISRISSSLQAASHLVAITSTGPVNINGLAFDMKGNGTVTNNTFDALFISGPTQGTGPSQVTFVNNTVQNAQNVGFQCTDCSNITHTGNYYYHNYWFGASFGGDGGSGGTGSNPTYVQGFSSSANVYNDTPIGLGLNFFMRGLTVGADTFVKSGLALVQMQDAKPDISGASFYGYSTYGKGTLGTSDHVFMEGVSNATVSVYSDGAFHHGVNCQGTVLQIAPGPIIALPCNNIHVSSIITNSGTQPVSITASSFPGAITTCTNANPVVCTANLSGQPAVPFSPQSGQNVTLSGFTGGWSSLNGTFAATNISSATFSVPIDSTGFGTFSATSPAWDILGAQNFIQESSITNGLTCGVMTDTVGGYISGNTCDTTQVGGFVMSNVIGGTIDHNEVHNAGLALNDSYYGIDLQNTLNVSIKDNSVRNDSGVNQLHICIVDEAENASVASGTTTANNEALGCTSSYVPAGIPAVGSFQTGATRQAFPLNNQNPLGYIYNGTNWLSTGLLGNPGTPTLGTCGTGSTIGGTNNNFVVDVGPGGGTTSCVVNFAPHFSGTPVCGQPAIINNTITGRITSLSSSSMTVAFSSILSGFDWSQSCQ